MELPAASMSQVNMFLEEPAAFFIRYVMGVKSEGGVKAQRGKAVEHAVNRMLLNKLSIPEAMIEASNEFRNLTGGEVTDAIDDEAANVIDMANLALKHFAGIGETLIQSQHKVAWEFDGLPVIGYIDYRFETFLVDLKTTKAAPSKIRDKDARQVAFYSMVEKLPARVVYVTAKKVVELELSRQQFENALEEVRWGLRAIARIRKGQDNWRAWASLFPPRNLSSYHYDEHTRLIAREIWSEE